MPDLSVHFSIDTSNNFIIIFDDVYDEGVSFQLLQGVNLILSYTLAAVKTNDTMWAKNLTAKIGTHIDDTKRHIGVTWYYWLCLLELPLETAKSEIIRYKGAFYDN